MSKLIYQFGTETLHGCFYKPVGVASSTIIPDSQMTASSFWKEKINCGAMYGRLFNMSGFGWCAGDNRTTDKSNWLQVDLGKEFYVGAVATQGGTWYIYTTDFKLFYSSDEGTWQAYQNGNGEELVIWMSI